MHFSLVSISDNVFILVIQNKSFAFNLAFYLYFFQQSSIKMTADSIFLSSGLHFTICNNFARNALPLRRRIWDRKGEKEEGERERANTPHRVCRVPERVTRVRESCMVQVQDAIRLHPPLLSPGRTFKFVREPATTLGTATTGRTPQSQSTILRSEEIWYCLLTLLTAYRK